MEKKLRAKDIPHNHHEDPSGFWKLVRTGKELPQIGQVILFVYDARGTPEEWRHDMLARISNGDPYKITNDALERGTMRRLPRAVEALQAETLRLPVDTYKPSTHLGKVREIGYCKALDEHWIGVEPERGFWAKTFFSEHIKYWAPFPEAPQNAYIPVSEDIGDSCAHHVRTRDFEIQERWDNRREVRKMRQSTLE